VIREVGTYSLDLVSGHALNGLDGLSGVDDRRAVNEAGAGWDDAGTAAISTRENGKLGLGNRLGQVLLRDTALGHALEGLDGLLSGLADSTSRAVDLDGKQTGIRVSVVGSLRGGSRGGGLGQQGKARSPLDVGLAAEQGNKDGGLGLVGVEGGTREGNDERILARAGNALLAAVVLGRRAGQGVLGLGGNRLEERLDPLGQPGLAGTIGDDGNVGLGVGERGESGNVVLVQVRRDRGVGRRIEGSTKAGVEGSRVGGIEGNSGGVDLSLLEVDDVLDLLMVLVGCQG
jgi:hypothetical protein